MIAAWQIARVEGWRMIRNPFLLAPLGLNYIWVSEVRNLSPTDDPLDVYWLLIGYSLVLTAFLMLAITVLAVLRSRSSHTDGLLDTLPVGREMRSISHGLAGLAGGAFGAVVIAVCFVVLSPNAVIGTTRDTIPSGVDIPRPNLAQLLQGPMAIVVFCALGVALARWIPSWLVVIALVIPVGMQFLFFGIWNGAGLRPHNWWWPLSSGMIVDEWVGCSSTDPTCELPLSGFDRVTPWWHLAYMVALAAALVVVAVLRDRRDRRAWWLAAGAFGMVVVLAAVQWVVYERYVPGV